MSTDLAEKEKRKKDWSIRGLLKIVSNSLSGIKHFFRYERSAIIYLIACFLCIGSGLLLQISSIMEWIVILFVLLSILSLELVNTAIEAICDLVSPEYNINVKIAKDCASAATGVLTLFGWAVVTVIYFPYIIYLIRSIF